MSSYDLSRALPAGLSAAINSSAYVKFIAIDLLFDAPNQLYLWSGIGETTIDGNTYTGAGELLGVSGVNETSDVSARQVELSLSGLDPTLSALALNQPYQDRDCVIRVGLVGYSEADAPEYAEPAAWYSIYSGKMDELNFTITPESLTFAMVVRDELLDLRKPRLRRYTDEDHQSRYSGDVFFGFVNRIQTERLEWAG
jgi:hypothetical protein